MQWKRTRGVLVRVVVCLATLWVAAPARAQLDALPASVIQARSISGSAQDQIEQYVAAHADRLSAGD